MMVPIGKGRKGKRKEKERTKKEYYMLSNNVELCLII
jgi:hypothetical protein